MNGTIRKKNTPEIVLARRYFSAMFRQWLYKDHAAKHGISGDKLKRTMQILDKRAVKAQHEMQKHFITPQLKHKNPENIEDNFLRRQNAWNRYFYGMSREEHESFKKWEEIYRRSGACPEYEGIKLPKRYEPPLTDLTEEQWQEIKKDNPNCNDALKLSLAMAKFDNLEKPTRDI